jgi:hypothetical protein
MGVGLDGMLAIGVWQTMEGSTVEPVPRGEPIN